MSWNVAISIDGRRLEALTLDLVQIRYGRRNARQQPAATSCVLGLVWKSIDALFEVDQLRLGAPVRIDVELTDAPFPDTVTRFDGAITDVTVGRNTAQIIAATNILGRLGRTIIDAPALSGPIPAAADDLWDAIETAHPDLGFDYIPLSPAPVDVSVDMPARAGSNALQAFQQLLENDPAGFVYEDISPPRLRISTGATRLSDQIVTTLAIPEAAVIDDVRLERTVAARANQVTVEWTGGAVTAEAGPNLRRYGPYGQNLTTEIDNADDATAAALRLAAAGGSDGWTFDSLPIEVAELTPFISLNAFLNLLRINRLLQLPVLPAGLPSLPSLVWLEGWDETITRERWNLDLHISDPRLIGWPQRYFEVPATIRWVDLTGPRWDQLDDLPWDQQPSWAIWEDYSPTWDDLLTEWIT